jgi:hypothetical protein
MQRVNIFNQIHKGLRAALYETAQFLQQADFSNEKETEEAVSKTKEVLMLFDEHAGKEDRYILPAIQPFEPSIVDSFEQEHEKDLSLSAALNHSLDSLHYLNTDQEKIEAGKNINREFVAFLCFNLEHMAREEDMINKILWRYFDDAYILGIQRTIVESTQPWHNDFFSKWMLRGTNNGEIEGWLKAVRTSAPTVVFNTLYTKAEQELPRQRFHQIKVSLSETTLPV